MSEPYVCSKGTLHWGDHKRTVPSAEQDNNCNFELCIDRPQTASVWPFKVAVRTLGSERFIHSLKHVVDRNTKFNNLKYWVIANLWHCNYNF